MRFFNINLKIIILTNHPLFFCLNSISPKNIIAGKIVPVNKPVLSPICSRLRPWDTQRDSPCPDTNIMSDTFPASHGPREQPMSPQMAKIPNIRVPPRGKVVEDKLKTPGHIRLTDNPHKLQNSRETKGLELNMVTRYEVTHRILLPIRLIRKGSLSLKKPYIVLPMAINKANNPGPNKSP